MTLFYLTTLHKENQELKAENKQLKQTNEGLLTAVASLQREDGSALPDGIAGESRITLALMGISWTRSSVHS